MLMSTLVPSVTYASGAYSGFNWTNINAALTAAGGTSITAADSVERVIYALLQLIQLKQNAGSVTSITSGLLVGAAGITQNVDWETSNANFTRSDVQTIQAAFRLTNSTLQAGGNVASV